MNITQDELIELDVLLNSSGWNIFSRWLSEHNNETFDRIDDDLESSITSIFKREQLLGAHKHAKFLLTDFRNFVQTQKYTQNDN